MENALFSFRKLTKNSLSNFLPNLWDIKSMSLHHKSRHWELYIYDIYNYLRAFVEELLVLEEELDRGVSLTDGILSMKFFNNLKHFSSLGSYRFTNIIDHLPYHHPVAYNCQLSLWMEIPSWSSGVFDPTVQNPTIALADTFRYYKLQFFIFSKRGCYEPGNYFHGSLCSARSNKVRAQSRVRKPQT